jgi:hypothetical protein
MSTKKFPNRELFCFFSIAFNGLPFPYALFFLFRMPLNFSFYCQDQRKVHLPQKRIRFINLPQSSAAFAVNVQRLVMSQSIKKVQLNVFALQVLLQQIPELSYLAPKA